MKRTRVQSEALRSVGYDVDMRMLEIEFTSGATNRYFDVPEHVHIGLMTAESHGEFYARFILYAGFDFEQVA